MERSLKVVSWIFFDLGEVLSQSPPHLQNLAGLMGADSASFEQAYWSFRDAYDAGGSAEVYWAEVARAVRRSVTPAMVEELTREDVSAWVTLHPASIGLLEELAGRPARLGVLSNAPTTLASSVRSRPWARIFDELVFSADIGVGKPDPRSYKLATAATGAAPAEIVFFDDRPANVAGAEQAGWQSYLWTGHADARGVLTDLGVF